MRHVEIEPPRSPTSCGSLPPEGALRLRPGKASSAAPAGEEASLRPRMTGRQLTSEVALRLRPGKASSAAPAGQYSRSSAIVRLARFKAGFATFLIAAYPHFTCAQGTFDAKNALQTPAAAATTPGFVAGLAGSCKPLYLTIDTGHMEVAPLMAEIFNRQQIRVTFFGANERTKTGNGSLSNDWAPWWKARAAEGHEFASHTYDHVYWRGDLKGVEPRFRIRPSAGAFEGREFTWDAKKYCEQISQAGDRLQDITGKKPLPLFRAPGGKTSPRLLAAAKACGFEHVGWSSAGFLGDELPSEKYPNDALLKKALKDIRSGDILLAHLGIWSRTDPWAPAVLEPLITGLKADGFCFKTLRDHPQYRDWIRASSPTPAVPAPVAR